MPFNLKLQDLLESGVHFGHQTGRWNPKMRPFIFTAKNGVHVINLATTLAYAEDAYHKVVQTVAQGGTVLFVGTKPQARDVVKEAALSCGQFYMINRWLGGTLTNLRTMRKSVEKIKKLQEMEADGTFQLMTKKEALKAKRERDKMLLDLEGIMEMKRAPSIVFVLDIGQDTIAVDEANRLAIPVIGLCDTNSNPSRLEYPIPANDDAVRSIRTFAEMVAQACKEGEVERQQVLRSQEEEAAEGKETLADTFIDADQEEELLTMRTVIKKVKKTDGTEVAAPADAAAAAAATSEGMPAAAPTAAPAAKPKPAAAPVAAKKDNKPAGKPGEKRPGGQPGAKRPVKREKGE